MTNHHSKTKLLLVSLVMVGAMLACNLPGASPATQEAPIPVSTEAMEALATQVMEAAQTAQAGGDFTLQMTEQQLTSAAAIELGAQTNNEIRDVQVRLRDGLMIVSGTTTQSGVNLPVTISLAFTIDPNSNPHSQVVEAKVGPFSMPQSVVDQIQGRIDPLIMQQLGGTSSEIAVDSIVIADGQLTIAAHRR